MSQVSIVSFLGTLLTSIQGWVFLKIPTTGTMTSQNVKDTCEKSGYSATCYCSSWGCPSYDDGNNCVKTFKHWQADLADTAQTLPGISSKICSENADPTSWWKCEPMDGICQYMKTNYDYGGAQCSNEAGSTVSGRSLSNKWSSCAFKL